MSSTAPAQADELESLLGNMLGASGEAPGGAFTVSSLLGMMSAASPDAAAATSAVKAGPGVNGMAGRQRQRKGVRAKANEVLPPAELPKEDDRSLEDLLRDLGEQTDAPAGSQKSKKKMPKQAQAVAKQPSSTASSHKGEIVLGKSTQQPKQQPTLEARHEDTHYQASTEDENQPDGLAEGWQVVQQKPTRRAPVSGGSSIASTRGLPADKAVISESGATAGTPSAGEISTCLHREEETSPSLNTIELKQTANTSQPVASSQKSVRQPRRGGSTDYTDLLGSSQSFHRDAISNTRNESCRQVCAKGTSSEAQTAPGSEACACTENTESTAGVAIEKFEAAVAAVPAADSDERTADTPTPNSWNYRPSVGTWFHPSPTFSQARRRSLSDGDRPFAMSGDSSGGESDGMSESGGAVTSSTHCNNWRLRPSVGTWLQTPRAQREPQLWPATPESTPPASPRELDAGATHHGQVVWMPIPIYLVGEVQRLISGRAMQGFAGA
eukprot:TRINITY_DN22094_c0_g1_i1.p1 TRINITY_DN22094_c0_g1~~TRINITY_DN22094_c0_g1_i1.p1  ORF type:complete len:498 (-),score=85.53 TRINITY_DN22094_c0_g1_i1:472-1965(-)